MDIQHDPKKHRFFQEVTGGTAELVYRRVDDRTLDLLHTTVPHESGGQGIAGKLATAAFTWARQNGVRLIPSCPFVQKWLDRHPEERDLVSVPTSGR